MVAFGKFEAKKENGQFFLEVEPDLCPEVWYHMKKKEARLMDISGVEDDRLKVVYHFDVEGKLFHVIVPVPADNPKIKSICKAFPAAVLYERELQEMFGILVVDHPNMQPLFLPDELAGKTPGRRFTAKD